ncbi:MAG: hypothetical protein HY255_01335 [Betaproteobacteria bacterium]|nr:hypothetical protein [Betaproteobacteria bacterium]
MPITPTQAIELANQKLASMGAGVCELCLIHELREEFDCGWIFYYQSARYLESKDGRDMVGGNAPLFVARADGKLYTISYYRPVEESMAAYRACGNPNAREVPIVQVEGWRPGAAAISAIKAVREFSGLGLSEGKRIIDDCFAKRSPRVTVADLQAARDLVAALASFGFDASVQYEGKNQGNRAQ